ncbi:PAS domain S-box protein [Sulfurospirillum arcachonense]|uniref:PAS domain S-box protein n=1 Tax=Sulfurospirillum arcachonense TaxID=57666 RepID=UPI0004683687|nr:PAS domain S-box protein [Sulfurospirillum arcachonense]
MLKIYITLAFIVVNIIFHSFTESSKNNMIDKTLETHENRIVDNYKTLQYNERKTADVVSVYLIKSGIDILSKLDNADENEKAVLRKELYDKLKDRYQQLNTRWGIYQLQFTLPDGKNFLRMHKPEKFGDNLEEIRHSIKYVNEHKTILRGLEGGKTTHGIRNLYPIFKDDKYLGLVEVSFTTVFIQDFFSQAKNIHTHVLLHKSLFKNEIWNKENLNLQYEISAENEEYLLLLGKQHLKEIYIVPSRERILSTDIDMKKMMNKNRPFSIYIKNDVAHNDVVSFVPILNTKGGVSAWLVSYEKDQFIEDILNFTLIFRIFIFILLCVIFYFVYKTLNEKNKLNAAVEEKTKELNTNIINLEKMNKELFSQQLFTKTLMDNTPVPLFYKDTNGVYLGVNKEFENIFGFTKEEIVGKSVYDIAPHEIADKYHKEDLAVFNDPLLHQVYDFVVKHNKTGKTHDVVFHKRAYLDEDGKVAGLIGAVFDMTEKLQYKKRLLEYSNELKYLNETLENQVKKRTADLQNAQKLAKLGTWKLDINSHTLKWCDEAYNIFEVDKREKPTLTLTDFLDCIHIEDGLDFFNSYNKKHLMEHNTYILVHKIVTKNGNLKYVEERCETKYDENNNPIFSKGTVQDITEQKVVELELQKKNEQLIQQAKLAQMGELLSMIAHQWRQPLGSIGGAVANIQNKLALDKYDLSKKADRLKFLEFLTSKLENITQYNGFLSKTIDDFRNFYKENKEKQNMLISECIESTIEIILPSLKNHNIELNTNYNSSQKIDIYPNEVMQVILNLLKNSEDALIENNITSKVIDIKTYEKNNSVIVSIKDNGGGVPKMSLNEIFEPYFSTKKNKNGTGLGLYMSKMIVEEHHGGKLEATNSNNGLEVLITIPKA